MTVKEKTRTLDKVHKINNMKIKTKRLTLRMWNASDINAFSNFFADEKNAKYVGGRKNADDAWRHLALQIGHWELKEFGSWAIERKDNGIFIGCASLWQSPGWPELELGYWLIEKYRGYGYAREAAQKCMDYAKSILKATSLVSYIDSENLASIRLAESIGAKYEKTIDLVELGPHMVFRYF